MHGKKGAKQQNSASHGTSNPGTNLDPDETPPQDGTSESHVSEPFMHDPVVGTAILNATSVVRKMDNAPSSILQTLDEMFGGTDGDDKPSCH